MKNNRYLQILGKHPILIMLGLMFFIAVILPNFLIYVVFHDTLGPVFASRSPLDDFIFNNPLSMLIAAWIIVGIIVFIVFRSRIRRGDNDYYILTGRYQSLTPKGFREDVGVRIKLFIINFLLLIAFVICPLLIILELYIWKKYWNGYFDSGEFTELKKKIDANTKEWNKLNEHVGELRDSFDAYYKKYQGTSHFEDKSLFNFSRQYLADHTKDPYIYSCSLQVMRNSCNKPFWYLCKYFNFDKDEKTLNKIEQTFNDYASAEQGKEILLEEREDLLNEIYFDVPFLVRRYKKLMLFYRLGFDLFDKDFGYYPVFVFDYVSAGGNSHQSNNIVLDVDGMEDFARWLDGEVKYKKSAKAQRSLMTQKLREYIKERDNYTCQICGNSTHNEPNLLLEIDHILPISKGGITCEDNLQTLCWRCNRAKGSKTD